jgi:flagellar basal body-associated protein FliL
MEKSKGAALIIVTVIIVSCIVGGFVSSLYFGPDNEVEDVLEEITEHEIESETGAQPGSLKEEVELLFPHNKETEK